MNRKIPYYFLVMVSWFYIILGILSLIPIVNLFVFLISRYLIIAPEGLVLFSATNYFCFGSSGCGNILPILIIGILSILGGILARIGADGLLRREQKGNYIWKILIAISWVSIASNWFLAAKDHRWLIAALFSTFWGVLYSISYSALYKNA
jgi:hypothetical protein